MIKSKRCVTEFIVVFLLLAPVVPSYAQTKTHLGVHPSAMRSLTTAVAVGSESRLQHLGSGGEFVVPSGKFFVLTDLIIQPQVFPPPGHYLIHVLPTSGSRFLSSLLVTCSGTDPSCFQVNLTGGMLFAAGSKVRVLLNPSSGGPVTISAFGYLVAK